MSSLAAPSSPVCHVSTNASLTTTPSRAPGSLFSPRRSPRGHKRSSQEFAATILSSSPAKRPCAELSSIDPEQEFEEQHGLYLFKKRYEERFKQWVNDMNAEGGQKRRDKVKGANLGVEKEGTGWSTAWRFFEERASRKGGLKVICSRCDSILVHSGYDGTTRMRNHLLSKKCHLEGERRGMGRAAVLAQLGATVSVRCAVPATIPATVLATVPATVRSFGGFPAIQMIY